MCRRVEKGRTFINLFIDTIVSHIFVERAMHKAFKLSGYWRHLDYFLVKT